MAGEDTTEDRIAGLEARITELQSELAATRQQLTDAQLDQWKGRIDELEVQMHLGRLDAEQQMEPVLEQLRNWWLDAREQLTQTGSAASSLAGDTFASLRSGVDKAMDQLRDGMRSARRPGD
jgi:chromosome segregation ATPase